MKKLNYEGIKLNAREKKIFCSGISLGLLIGLIFWFLCPIVSNKLVLMFLGSKGSGHSMSYIVPLLYAGILGWNIAINNNYERKITLVCSMLLVFLLFFLIQVFFPKKILHVHGKHRSTQQYLYL